MFCCYEMLAPESIMKLSKKFKLYGPEEVILLPLYPQYSAATSGSSIKEWKEYM